VLNVAQPSKKEPQPIIGLPMAKFIAFPVVNPNTGNSSQLQQMKKFSKELAIHSPADL
jgi:hypothetical protein